MRRKLIISLVAVALAVVLATGIAQLFSIRMESGDVYPAYSTLRADPIGAKAFAEALADVPGVQMRRSFRTGRRDDSPATILYLGIGRGDLAAGTRRMLDRIALGSRVVMTLTPENLDHRWAATPTPKPKASPTPKSSPAPKKDAPTATPARDEKAATPATPAKSKSAPADSKKTKKGGQDSQEDEDEEEAMHRIELEQTWGVKVDTWGGAKRKAFNEEATLKEAALGLEPEIRWHSAAYFSALAPAWRVIYECRDKPVAIERAWGNGTVVLASDSYLLSNEALHSEERHAKLLAWLVGPHHTVIFDEQHLGIHEQGGVAMLVVKYRLHGVVAGLVLLAALFIWQQVAPFAPRPRERARPDEEIVTGRGADEGLITLLRRSLPPNRLLETLMTEWRRTGGSPPGERARVETAWAQVHETAQKPRAIVDAYRAILAAARGREK